MACLGFRGDQSWVGAGWAFRAMIDDVLRSSDLDSATQTDFEVAKDVGHLFIDDELNEDIDASKAIVLRAVFKTMAQQILGGRQQSVLEDFDPEDVPEYKLGLKELLELIAASEKSDTDTNSGT